MIPIMTKFTQPSNYRLNNQQPVKNLQPALNPNRQNEYYALVRSNGLKYPEFDVVENAEPVCFPECRDLDLYGYWENNCFKICEGKTGAMVSMSQVGMKETRALARERILGLFDHPVFTMSPAQYVDDSIERSIRQWGLSPRYKWEER